LRHLAKGNYDIVHMHLPVAGWMGIVAKLFTGKKTKFIYSEHNLVTHYSKYNYNLSGLTYSYFDAVIYVSHEVGEVIKQSQKGRFFKTKKAVTILNGIDTEKFDNSNKLNGQKDKLTVGLVARFRPQKRVERWAEVAAEVKKLSDKFNFLMVGDGPSDGLLRERMAELGLKENADIVLPGQQTDTVASYKQIDIFLLTSDFEGCRLRCLKR
jgi:glycosyltransferase involved in cell wall biosynthesis